MTGAEAVQPIIDLNPRIVIPAHFSGWSHFRDGEHGMWSAVGDAPVAIREKVRWLPEGIATDVAETPTPSRQHRGG